MQLLMLYYILVVALSLYSNMLNIQNKPVLKHQSRDLAQLLIYSSADMLLVCSVQGYVHRQSHRIPCLIWSESELKWEVHICKPRDKNNIFSGVQKSQVLFMRLSRHRGKLSVMVPALLFVLFVCVCVCVRVCKISV